MRQVLIGGFLALAFGIAAISVVPTAGFAVIALDAFVGDHFATPRRTPLPLEGVRPSPRPDRGTKTAQPPSGGGNS